MTTEQMVESISNMTVGELVALTKSLQTTFGIEPSDLYSHRGLTLSTPEVLPEVEEPTEFDLYILAAGPTKIQVIKRVRELVALGLKEAKELVDNLPAPLRTRINIGEAELLKAALEKEGATMELRPIV